MRRSGPVLLAALLVSGIPPGAHPPARADQSSAPAPAPGGAAVDPARLAREGEDLYRSGAYAEALKRFEAVIAAGRETPAVLYAAGSCWGQAMGNREKELELKKRAIPLLEKEIAGGSASIDGYYWLAAIYVNDLNDPVKGTDVARKGAAVLEKRKDATYERDTLFRIGRLYTFLGRDAEAASWYERYTSANGPVDRRALRIALEDTANLRLKQKEYEAAARTYEQIVGLDPLRDEERHQWGRALLLAGRPVEAATAWRAAHSDELRTELNYLAGVAEKYHALGAPSVSKLLPKYAAADDETLAAKINEAAEPLRQARAKEDEARRAREEKERIEREEAEKARIKDPEAIRAKFKAKMKNAPPPADPNSDEPGAGDPWKALRTMGLTPTPGPPAVPVSPEKIAAEKEFFVLMTEYVRRGRLIRNFCFENGLVEMIFR